MKIRRLVSLMMALMLAIALAVPASAAELTYDVPGGKIRYDGININKMTPPPGPLPAATTQLPRQTSLPKSTASLSQPSEVPPLPSGMI